MGTYGVAYDIERLLKPFQTYSVNLRGVAEPHPFFVKQQKNRQIPAGSRSSPVRVYKLSLVFSR